MAGTTRPKGHGHGLVLGGQHTASSVPCWPDDLYAVGCTLHIFTPRRRGARHRLASEWAEASVVRSGAMSSTDLGRREAINQRTSTRAHRGARRADAFIYAGVDRLALRAGAATRCSVRRSLCRRRVQLHRSEHSLSSQSSRHVRCLLLRPAFGGDARQRRLSGLRRACRGRRVRVWRERAPCALDGARPAQQPLCGRRHASRQQPLRRVARLAVSTRHTADDVHRAQRAARAIRRLVSP